MTAAPSSWTEPLPMWRRLVSAAQMASGSRPTARLLIPGSSWATAGRAAPQCLSLFMEGGGGLHGGLALCGWDTAQGLDSCSRLCPLSSIHNKAQAVLRLPLPSLSLVPWGGLGAGDLVSSTAHGVG